MQQPHHELSKQERDMPFYGNSWSPFMDHAEMRSQMSRPYFVSDSIPSEAESERLDRSLTKIFMGPPGTLTRLHNDTYHTHAWLSQIRGSKQFILYPPSQVNFSSIAAPAPHSCSSTPFQPPCAIHRAPRNACEVPAVLYHPPSTNCRHPINTPSS